MDEFKKAIIELLSTEIKIDTATIEIPPDSKMGDYAMPCFGFAKELKKAPNIIAFELVEKIKAKIQTNEYIDNVQNTGPYVNFFINKSKFAEMILNEIANKKQKFGKNPIKNEKTMIEFCQVNTHKAFHVGHLRGTFLGASLVEIFKFSGYDVIAANYQGDIGAHVAKVIWYLEKYKTNLEFPKVHKGQWLGRIYQKANSILNDDKISKEDKETLKKEVSEVLQKLEQKDMELTKLWSETREWCLTDYREFYNEIGVKFDELFFESQYEKPGKMIVEDMLAQGIAEKSEGAVIINLEKHKLGKFLLLKSDGTALYSTKDLALARDKFDKFKIDRSIYVVGAEQKMYFQQIFKTLEHMGYEKAKDCVHVPYGLVNLEGGKISSREGELIYAEELVHETIESAKKAVTDRHTGLSKSDIQNRADKIGLAAIKFSFLNQDNNKEIVFDKEKSLSFEGETGPYIQYTYARISSILRKANLDINGIDKIFENVKKSNWQPDWLEHNLIKKLSGYPTVVFDTQNHYKPMLICRYLLDLCQIFNEFYHKNPILKEEDENIKNSRLTLCNSINLIIKSGLNLLGIQVLEEM